LIAGAGNAAELALYNSLPQGAVPTDSGDTARVSVPSAALRALGLIAPVADPVGEQARFGAPPSIVFNSNPRVPYDFNPRDGITPGQGDFEALAAHEVGHVLGFTSFVGLRELNPERDLFLSIWDIFRFRPGSATSAVVSPASFTSSQRILSSGGDQVFFAGEQELPLSTARPDGSGGDGFQAAHWKDNRFTGQIIGIMDPIFTAGDRGVITENDIAVLNAIGYGTFEADAGAPSLKSVTFNGSALTIKGKDLTGNLQLEINFEIIAPPLRIKPKSSGKKAKVSGSQEQLNLTGGPNQVRVIKDGLRSNIFVLSL